MERICGTCRYARIEGDGPGTVCTHEEGHRFTVESAVCRRPRQWWRPRPDLAETRGEVRACSSS